MAKKLMSFKTKGMNRDLSVSAFNPEFAFENMNLRLATNEGNTTLSWVNEKGTLHMNVYSSIVPEYWSKDGEEDVYEDPHDDSWTHHDAVYTQLNLDGKPVGTAVINHKLVLFTTEAGPDSPHKDCIYLIWYNEERTDLLGKVLFEGHLNLSTEYPLETMVSYEADHIQKVYWTDGLNQPRLINIAGDSSRLTDLSFDFVPEFSTPVSIAVAKNKASNGLFAPGVIQYAVTYLNKHMQQTNVIVVSQLMYISPNDRAANPEEKVSNSFTINITKADGNFEYIRLYSIQRTSINAVPVVKVLEDIKLTPKEDSGVGYNIAYDVTYTDTGTTGYVIDPTELLYVGGRDITALTMTEKDGTLFMGNITQRNILVDALQDIITEDLDEVTPHIVTSLSFVRGRAEKQLQLNHTTGIYSHTNTLNEDITKISTFKGGETYRLGFQLQKKTGEWTSPIFLKDLKNDLYPYSKVFSDTVGLVSAEGTIDFSYLVNTLRYDMSPFVRVRPVIVYPTLSDRTVLCQGVLNPTVFNVQDRKNNSPFAQASWFFRPYMAAPTQEQERGGVADAFVDVEGSLTPDTSVDAPFQGDVHKVYAALVVPISEEALNTILSEKRVKGSFNGTGGTEHFPIIGVLPALTPTKYILISDSPLPAPKTVSTPGYVYEQLDMTDIIVDKNDDENHQYRLYNGIYTDGGYLRYNGTDLTAPGVDTSTYTFRFKIGNDYYIATFSSQSDSDYSVIHADETQGTSLKFTHYESLPTQAENTGTDPYIGTGGIKGVEIQGSRKSYASPFDTSGTNADKSNTQFFVDQSIVTLNSPDIEFDQEVQVINPEGLTLRVIGAIPVTANISAHSIAIGSSMLETSNTYSKEVNYVGGIMSITEHTDKDTEFGNGEKSYNVIHKNIDIYGGKRLVSEYLWNDVAVASGADSNNEENGAVKTSTDRVDYVIHPWQRSGSLNSDSRPSSMAASLLKTKKESNMLFSINTEYFSATPPSYNVSVQMALTENDEVMNYRLPKQRDVIDALTPATSEINYYANIDKVLYNEIGYQPIRSAKGDAGIFETATIFSPVSMRYKSTSHAVLATKAYTYGTDSGKVPILPFGDNVGSYGALYPGQYGSLTEAFWGDKVLFSQTNIDSLLSDLFIYDNAGTPEHIKFNYLWLGELYRDIDDDTRFGGKSKEALRANTWCVAGNALNLSSTVTLKWTFGDTFFQRYDCLKTYPFTREDPNQLVEILSFMCETHVNIDGRYDRNRGQADNTNMSPQNFNLLNPVYSQRDNFFTSRIVDNDGQAELRYPNQITFSKRKESGADVDLWTNVTLASTLELDGDKGQVTSLQRLDDQIIAFQESGISRILYNENVQISTEEGSPIEMANSGKVLGKKYLSTSIGCSNKWSVCNTPSGIYFIDSNDRSIYLFNGQLANLSLSKGMNSWSKQNITQDIWNPEDFKGFVSYYDKQNQDVLFINNDRALAWSEKLGVFTSFYDYGGVPYLANLDDVSIWLRPGYGQSRYLTSLAKHQGGNYCHFFGTSKPYWMTLVGNPEPQTDKIFTNLEFRACVGGDGEPMQEASLFNFTLPFDSLETWNEYQHGIANLGIRSGLDAFKHPTASDGNATLKRKFRIWRCDIPRDNVNIVTTEPVLPENPTEEEREAYEAAMVKYNQYLADVENGIYRKASHPVDRMRNPWLYIKLMKNAASLGSLKKMEVHDLVMTYFN